MADESEQHVDPPRGAHVARIPGFNPDAEVGLGDVVKRATTMLGIKPCGGCHRRAEAMNSWLAFSGRPRRR
jgi:hypothetical protein